MAETSRPWTGEATGDCGPYSASLWDDIFQVIAAGDQGVAQGVLLGVDNALAVSGASSPVSVATGRAFVNGKWYKNDAAKNLTVDTPAASTRTDYVILQSDYTAQTVRAVVLKNGAEGTGTPPALTQVDGTKWEIPLARLDITTGGVITVTDARVYCQFATEVITAMLQDLCVVAGKLAANAVGTAQIADDAVTADKIDNDLNGATIGLRAAEVSEQVKILLNPTDTYFCNGQSLSKDGVWTSADLRGSYQIPADALGVVMGISYKSDTAHCGLLISSADKTPDFFDHRAPQVQVANQYGEADSMMVKFGTGANAGKIKVKAWASGASVSMTAIYAWAQGYISKV